MLRFFQFNHPIAYLFLLVLSLLFRIPSFEMGFVSEEENLLLNTVIRMNDGFSLYSETLSSVSPLLAGIWYFFYWLFGENCLLAIRIFTGIYLFITAFIFNQLINNLKLSREKSLFPGIAFLLGVNFPWYSQQMNGEVLVLLPLLLSVYLIIRTFEDGVKPMQLLLMVGILTSLSVLLEYQSVLYYFGILLIYLTIRPARLNEIFTLFIGFFIPIFFCGLLLFYYGVFEFWIQCSLLYRLDEFINPQIVFLPPIPTAHKMESVMALLSIVIPLIGGFISFRIGVLGLNIRQRKIESVMSIWMGVSLFMLFILGVFRHDNVLLVIIFPLVFYTWRFFIGNINRLIGFILLILLIAYPTWSFTQYYFVSEKSKMNQFPDFSNTHRNEDLYYSIHPNPLSKASIYFIHKDSGNKYPKIWAPGNHSDISPLKDAKPACGFIDFNLFINKLSFLPDNQYRSLFSTELIEKDIYEKLSSEKPEYIIDYENIVPLLKYYLPVLMEDYRLLVHYPTPVYKRLVPSKSGF